jgi:hypothetical protein
MYLRQTKLFAKVRKKFFEKKLNLFCLFENKCLLLHFVFQNKIKIFFII